MSPNNDKLSLQKAIRDLHGCESTHVESVPVKETFEGLTVWEGVVEVFDLEGHPTATRAYAWSHAADGFERHRYVAVLHEGPVDSPEAAVRAAIVREAVISGEEKHGDAPNREVLHDSSAYLLAMAAGAIGGMVSAITAAVGKAVANYVSKRKKPPSPPPSN